MRAPINASRLAGTLFLTLVAAAQADDAPRLKHDPFREPDRVEVDATGGERGFEPILRSTIARGNDSLVNLGGHILAIGESIHGYKLIAVRPFDAIFVRKGRRITLEVAGATEGSR